MTFEEPSEPEEPGESKGASPEEPSGGDPGPGSGHGRLNLTDPRAIRALAHPIRWALLEALGDAGTLTATQASELLGESPANCAFHLRTLAKYGFVEEAGGGRGRERPWRQAYDGLSMSTLQDDPEASQAAQALNQVWLDRALARARLSLTSRASWPAAFDDNLGGYLSRIYVTPAEAGEIHRELEQVFERLVGLGSRYTERKNPKLRPPDALPVEFFLLGFPVPGVPPLPADEESEPESDDTDA
jgi:predicted transcriptional regulator